MHNLFRGKGERKNTIADKIDNFADKKASHFVNLKKLKQKDPVSMDIFENFQVRSTSRTFTGGLDMIRRRNLTKLVEPANVLNTSSTPSMLFRRVSVQEKSTGDLAEDFQLANTIGEDSKDDDEESLSSPLRLGDFYDRPKMLHRTSICYKDKSNTRSSKKIPERDSFPAPDESSQVRRNLADALKNGAEKPLLEEVQSYSDEDEGLSEVGKETASQEEKRIRKQSIFGHLKTWKLLRIIVKAGDDLRQEQFAMQLISQIDQIFKKKKLNIWLKAYEILATGKDCGLIEFLSDATSIDAFKKKNPSKPLEHYFTEKFTSRKALRKARDAFARSLAGYSLV